jgi:hypothetical protein
MKILVIAGDARMRHDLLRKLSTAGVKMVYEASNLTDGLSFIREVDAIICDEQFSLVPGGSPCHLAWASVRDAAQAMRKPFVLVGDPALNSEGTQPYVGLNEAPSAMTRLAPLPGRNGTAAPAAVFDGSNGQLVSTKPAT